MDHKRRLRGLALGLVLAAGAVGCTTVQRAEGQPATEAPAAAPVVSDPATATTITETQTETVRPVDTRGGSDAGGRITTTSRKPGTTTTTTTPSGARIDSFTVVRQPTCPVRGTPDAPFSSPGQDVVISWKVSGASGAAISVDNPDVYGGYGGDYPAAGQLELAFPCDPTAGKTTHTYTLWPKGAKTVSKTLTVTAANNAP
ncbi:hypothetical protein [Actinokineospora iranica]|uniref:Uncharacterized protein n=1 Tax=Actinokineospora iranica TaxID=1271860 RepID=A0A1G6IYR4_9PSEU|nr:hypothetical protein [Actinokineospora iranica]SDC11648.1 hypothetical protein SAMN05216174_101159 [Actinokineospora iranica]